MDTVLPGTTEATCRSWSISRPPSNTAGTMSSPCVRTTATIRCSRPANRRMHWFRLLRRHLPRLLVIAHNRVFITDPNYEDQEAGGGLFVSYDDVSEASARVRMAAHVRNLSGRSFRGRVVYELYDREGQLAASAEERLSVTNGAAKRAEARVTLSRPRLWSPDTPYLYRLHVYVKDQQGDVVDGYCRRIGIRSIEFRGKEGFWLNGKPYPWPLIGANRHQDFAVVGNALSNSLHWRDARKLRDAGLRVIRNAHYPQDPAFMDACDELGLFVIVNTPGWQFWNDDRVFAERVYSDIRNMVRRDRNHPSVWLWEPDSQRDMVSGGFRRECRANPA